MSTPQHSPARTSGSILVWMWCRGVLDVEMFSTLAEAVASARATEDDGDGSLMAIEGAPRDRIDAENARQKRAENEAREARYAARPAGPRWGVLLRGPEPGRDGRYTWASTGDEYFVEADAVEDCAAWIERLGADRAKVRKHPR